MVQIKLINSVVRKLEINLYFIVSEISEVKKINANLKDGFTQYNITSVNKLFTRTMAYIFHKFHFMGNVLGVRCTYCDHLVKYHEVVDYAISAGKISASLIQRKYRLGYNRAARIVDLLEERGIIGPQNGSKPREVIIKKEEREE